MRARIREQRGSALIIAIMCVLVMMAIGLGTFTLAQGQQRQSSDERIKDSSYSLAESALSSAVAYLGTTSLSQTSKWGYTAGQVGTTGPVGTTCGPSSASTDICPDPTTVTSAFTQTSDPQPDIGSSPQWTTTVLDNGPTGYENFYRESQSGTQPKYDANGDGKMWVRAQSTAQGRSRILVALVAPQPSSAPAPETGMAAYDIAIPGTTGTKYVDMQGSGTVAGRLALWCNNSYLPSQGGATCPSADATKGGIVPWTVQNSQYGYLCYDETGNPVVSGQATSWIGCWSSNSGADAIALRARAQAAGTYYNGTCPTSLTGDVVFIDYPTNYCSYTSGSNTWNSPSNPGTLVLGKYAVGVCAAAPNATCLNIGGNNTYYGFIYDANTYPDLSQAYRIGVTGTAQVVGAMITEFNGYIGVSSSRPGFVYDANAFGDFYGTSTSAGSLKIVPGTFREVPAGS